MNPKKPRKTQVATTPTIRQSLNDIKSSLNALNGGVESMKQGQDKMITAADAIKESIVAGNDHVKTLGICLKNSSENHDRSMGAISQSFKGIRTSFIILTSVLLIGIFCFCVVTLYWVKDPTEQTAVEVRKMSSDMSGKIEIVTHKLADVANMSGIGLMHIKQAIELEGEKTRVNSFMPISENIKKTSDILELMRKSNDKALIELEHLRQLKELKEVAAKARAELAEIKAVQKATSDAAEVARRERAQIEETARLERERRTGVQPTAADSTGTYLQQTAIVTPIPAPQIPYPVEAHKLSRPFSKEDIESGRVKLTDGMAGRIKARLYFKPVGNLFFKEPMDVPTPLQLPLEFGATEARFYSDVPFTVYLDQKW